MKKRSFCLEKEQELFCSLFLKPCCYIIIRWLEIPQKYKIAVIFEKSNVYLSGRHYDNVYYHFFMDALKRNENLFVWNYQKDLPKLETGQPKQVYKQLELETFANGTYGS